MGLSYLNKKNWHPEKFSNIEAVWKAENKESEIQRIKDERIKKLKEEKHIEDLKKMQVEAGIIPASSLQRLDWMYSDRQANQEKDAEEFLLGKPIEKIEKEEQFGEPQQGDEENEGKLEIELSISVHGNK